MPAFLGTRKNRPVKAWLRRPPIRAITDRWLHDSSDNNVDFHRDVGVSGLNLIAGYIGEKKSDDYVEFMKMERRLPVFIQQFSHALVVVASK